MVTGQVTKAEILTYRTIFNGILSFKKLCADIISVLAMCSDDSSEQQDCVNYRLMGSGEDIGQWGHEYVR